MTAGDSVCVLAGQLTSTSNPFYSPRVAITGDLDIGTNCTSGLAVINGNIAANSTIVLSGNALGSGVLANFGGAVTLPTALATATADAGVQMSLDNATATGTFASLSATFSCLTNLATGSKICRQ